MRLLLGAKSMPFGCMSMERLGAKYAEVGCKSMERLGAKYAVVGCKSMDTFGCCGNMVKTKVSSMHF